LVQFMHGGANAPTSFELDWNTAFGRAQQALKTRVFDATEVAVRVALRLIEFGQPGRWSARLDSTDLRVGSFVLGEVVEIRAQGDGQSAEINALTRKSRVHLARDHDTGQWKAEGDFQRLKDVGVNRRIVLIDRAVMNPWGGDQAFDGIRAVASVTPEAQRALEDGIRIHSDHKTGYLQWIERVLRELFV